MSSASQQEEMFFLLEHLKTLHNWAVSEEINLKFKFILNIVPQESLEVHQKLIHAPELVSANSFSSAFNYLLTKHLGILFYEFFVY